jgi:hypothetical protein
VSYGGASYAGASYAGGGAPVPPGDIFERAATVDTLDGVVALGATLDESALTGDAVVWTYSRSLAELAATVDALFAVTVLARSLNEHAITIDLVALAFKRAATETAFTADAIAGVGARHRFLVETAITTDVLTYVLKLFAHVTATTVVAPSISAFSTFAPPNPQPGNTGLHDYEVIVCDKYGVAFGQITSAVPTQIDWVLDDIGDVQIDCFILDPSLIELLPIAVFPGAREIQIWRDQECIWWGWPTSATFDAKQLHITGAGLLFPFSKRNFGPVLVNYLVNPQFEQPAPGGTVPGWTKSGVTASCINAASNSAWPILLGGQAVLLVQANPDVDTFIYQEVAVAGGEQGLFFDLSAWVYLVPGTTYGDAFAQRGLYIQFTPTGGGAPTDVEIQQITTATGQGTWVRLETGVLVPPGMTGTLQVRLYAPQGYTIWDACNLTVEESRGSAPTGSDVQQIIANIVEYAQEAASGKSPLAITFQGPVTGKSLIRIYQFSDNAGILDALNEFPTIGACDFEITWDRNGHQRAFTIYVPAKGHILYNEVLEIDLGTITDLQGTIDGTATSTTVRVLGQGSSGSSQDIGYAAFPSSLGGRTCTDGFIALGSNVVTGSLDFTPDDVGQGIYCLQAGVLPIGSTVSVYLSPTQVEFTNPSGLGAQMDVPFGSNGVFGVGGIVLESTTSALTDLPIGTLLGTAEQTLQRVLAAQFVPTARQRADGPNGLFGIVNTGDVIPVVFRYGWLTLGPVLMRVATVTLYPPTEELELQLNTVPILEASYGG